MKKLILCIPPAILLGQCAIAQSDTQGIVYDYLTGFLYRETADGSLRRIAHLPSVSAGNPVQLKVININTLKYTIQIERAEARLFTSVPSALDVLLPPLPAKAMVSTDDITGAARGFDTGRSGTAAVRAAALASRATALADELEAMEQTIDAAEALGDLGEDLLMLVRTWPDPRVEQGTPQEDPRGPGRTALEQLRKSAEKLVSGRIDAVTASSNVNRTARWREITRSLLSSINSHARTLDQLAYEIEDDALAVAGEIEVAKSKSTDPETEQPALMKLSAQLTRLKRQVAEGLQSGRERSAAIRSTASQREKLADDAEKLYLKIMNEDVFEKAAPPVTPRGDVIRFSIRIVPPEDKADGSLHALFLEEPPLEFYHRQDRQEPGVDVELRVVGRTKIDYSAGVFFTSLSDGSYFLSDEGGQLIVREGARDQFSFSFGALAHVYRTSTARWVPALSFGVAGADSGVQVLLGASVMTGLDQRFVFTAGVMGAKVTRLNGATVGEPFTGNASDLTKEVYRAGFFFGVTFNLR